MLTADFYETAKKEYQNCDRTTVFGAITKAIRLLEKKAHFDSSLGVIDVSVCDQCVTLPRFVGTVLAVNTLCGSTYLRDEWYQYHIGGVGSENWTDGGYTDVLGRFSTFRDPAVASRLVAVTESVADNNKKIRVYGFDEDGKRIFTPGASGSLEEGFLVPTISGYPLANPAAPLIARIERISKENTNGFVRLVAIDPDPETNDRVLVGHYEPGENNPSYLRIRLGCGAQWARIKYRKTYAEIRSLQDWINIENTLALQLAVKAVKLYEQDKYDAARQAEEEAGRMLSEEEERNKTPTPLGPQIVYDVENYSDSIWDDNRGGGRGLSYPWNR